jgi:hypothetical protein
MIHISKSPKTGRFYVGTLAPNFLELSASQPSGLSSRRAAVKNIRSQMKAWDAKQVRVQDNTRDKPAYLMVTPTRTSVITIASGKPYIPGRDQGKKNIKKKKKSR